MSGLYPRDFDVLARILAMREQQLAKLEEKRGRQWMVRRWTA